MIGRPVRDFIVDEKSPDPIPEEMAADQRIESYQRVFRRKDGRKVPVLMRHKLITVDYALLLARVGVEEQNAPAAGRGPGTARRESCKS